jgi:hypothetical protein
MPPRRRLPHPWPKADDLVHLIDGQSLSPVECALRGDAFPLVDRIRRREATEEEYKALIGMIEGDAKFPFQREARWHYQILKSKAEAIYTFRLEEQGYYLKDVIAAAAKEFGRLRSQINVARSRHRNDPEVKKGALKTPWKSRFWDDVLTDR